MWQHLVYTAVNGHDDIDIVLSDVEAGGGGWELVAAVHGRDNVDVVRLIFKRPAPGLTPFEQKVQAAQQRAERFGAK